MVATIAKLAVTVFTSVDRYRQDSGGHRHPGPLRNVRLALLSVTDSDGVTGYCIGQPDQLRESIVASHIRPEVVGADALNREQIWRQLTRRQRGTGGGLTDRGIGYVDQALWDLAGRKLNVPVWRLLGGARNSVPAYASTMCGDDIVTGLSTPEEYGAFAESLIKRGYPAIKLHTWMPPITHPDPVGMDIRACAAVREAVGPEVPLMLDASHWYSRTEALRLGKGLEGLNYYWYEEPMEESSVSSYRWLAEQLDIPVIGPETAWGRHHARAEWITSGACDIVRVGVNDVGGITPALKTVHLAEAFNMECEVHGGGAGNLALATGSYAGRWYERGLLHPHVDYDEVPPHLHAIVDAIDENGQVFAPELPGLGEQLDLDYIAEHTVGSW